MPVSSSGDTLISLIPSGNQWYRNDTVMDGDTASVLVVTMPGYYYDVVDSANGCSPDTSFGYSFGPPQTTCAAYFTISPVPGDTGLYTGVNQSSGDSINFIWEFGDGDTSSSPYPNHQYDSAGYYNICLTVYNDSCTNTYCDSTFYAWKTSGPPMNHIIINNPTAINQVQAVPAVSIFPNPANNVLMIRTSNIHATDIVVYDMQSRETLRQKFVPQLDISLLSSGIYIIEITGAEGSVMKRMIKM
jgi:hypothetical protein